jgi:tetratricopeptide (TPR) repeat protein
LAERARAAKYAPGLLCLLIAGLTARTWARNSDWKDDLSIAAASVRTSPRSYKAHDMLANALWASDPSHGNLDRVIEESEKTRAILEPLPDRDKPPHPYLFAATCYATRKDYGKAISLLREFVTVEAASPGRLNDLRQAYGYLTLSSLYLTTGDVGKASDAAERSRALDPMEPKIYLQMAELALKEKRMDDAFVRLTEGEFVTGDTNLRQALMDLYRRAIDPRSCVLTPGPDGPEMNPACDIVHAHVCAASAYVVRTLATEDQRDVALTRKKMFVEQFGCPKGPLDAALP